jgi:xanthine dehydrogenase accessory factor
MNHLKQIAKELIDIGEGFVVAEVIETSGSTPRKSGAMLLIKQDGTQYGTVGGGQLEAEVLKASLETLKTKDSKVYHYNIDSSSQDSLDMICGGDVDVKIEYVDKNKAESFLESFEQIKTAYIFGAGHIGKALEPILRYIGFETIVIDDRPEFSNRERFPHASDVITVRDYSNVYENITTDENSYIIIVTRGHRGDYEVLKQSLDQKYEYLGMIGSKKKIADTFKRLQEDGFSKEELDTIYTPIGIEIFAETPEEISISIAAEMIKVRAGHGKNE